MFGGDDINIIPNRTDNFPIKVIIKAFAGGPEVEIWSGRQQALFSKNSQQRKRTMDEIVENLMKFKESI